MATRTLVTGASGFAGSHLLDQLIAGDGELFAWGSPRSHFGTAHRERVQWSAVDIADADAVADAIARIRPDAVYHCAGAADVHGAWRNSARALRVNVMGTHALLTALERIGSSARILVTGSALVYRASPEALAEDAALAPASPYGVSKLAQEMVAVASKLPVIVTRSFNHAGPRQSDAYVTSSFARQIAEAEAGQRPPVLRVGNLEGERDITDVRDTVCAYRLLMKRGRAGQPYNVCRGQSYRVRLLLDRLVGQATLPISVEVDPERLRPVDNPVVLGDPSRLRAATGWEPRIDIDTTLRDLLDYWRRRVAEGPAS